MLDRHSFAYIWEFVWRLRLSGVLLIYVLIKNIFCRTYTKLCASHHMFNCSWETDFINNIMTLINPLNLTQTDSQKPVATHAVIRSFRLYGSYDTWWVYIYTRIRCMQHAGINNTVISSKHNARQRIKAFKFKVHFIMTDFRII